ncbi:MAG: hypothetical protein ACKVH8_02875 [Pirellulales bacterium]
MFRRAPIALLVLLMLSSTSLVEAGNRFHRSGHYGNGYRCADYGYSWAGRTSGWYDPTPPYFAKYPPVQYGLPKARVTYSSSYTPRAATPVALVKAQPLTISNPHVSQTVRTEADQVQLNQPKTVKPLVVINPFLVPKVALAN